jgi:hypothetical protein
LISRLINKQEWARTDERHVAHDDIKKLGEFIKPGGPEKATNGSKALDVCEAAPVCVHRIAQAFELVNANCAPVSSDAPLPEQYGRPKANRDKQAGKREQG